MKLSDIAVRTAKPRGKAYKLADGAGMYLLVKPDGKRYWRMDYRFHSKRKTLALGVYPGVSLKDAREKRDTAKHPRVAIFLVDADQQAETGKQP